MFVNIIFNLNSWGFAKPSKLFSSAAQGKKTIDIHTNYNFLFFTGRLLKNRFGFDISTLPWRFWLLDSTFILFFFFFPQV